MKKTPVILITAIIIILILSPLIFFNNSNENSSNENEEDKLALVQTPALDIEAEILSLSIDEDENNCLNTCPGSEFPKDKGVIKITKILSDNDPQNTLNIEISDEIEVGFKYSARPAKLIRNQALPSNTETEENPETPVSSQTYLANPIPFEDGYFIYKLSIPRDKEKTLPGLQEGNKIKVTNFNPILGIGEYEIVQ